MHTLVCEHGLILPTPSGTEPWQMVASDSEHIVTVDGAWQGACQWGGRPGHRGRNMHQAGCEGVHCTEYHTAGLG